MNQQQLKEGDVIFAKFDFNGHELPISGTIEFCKELNELAIVNEGGKTPLSNIVLLEIQIPKFKKGDMVAINYTPNVKSGIVQSVISVNLYTILCDNGGTYYFSSFGLTKTDSNVQP